MDVETVPLLLAFAAGVVSFISPCHLAVVPAFLGYLGGSAASATGSSAEVDRWVLIRRTLLFSLGFSLVMVALGISVGLVGYLVWDRVPLLRKVGGVLLLVFGLHTIGLLRLSLLYRELRFNLGTRQPRGDLGGLALGAAFGFGWTPCVGPVLAAILLLAAESATVWEGGLLLAIYAVGLSLPFTAVALLLSRTSTAVLWLRRFSRPVELVTGTLLMAMGVLLYTNQFQRVAAFLGTWAPL